ncbi:MAG: response regulator [bacterium]|nr:response regulator [bacterium]
MPAPSSKKTYCPSCGVEVDSYVILESGNEVTHCASCGLTLTDRLEAPPVKTLDCIVYAEDSDLLRNLITRLLVDKKIGREVIPCKNGAEFISNATRRLREKQPVNLGILDVEMPIINGIQAAVSLREIEKGLVAKKKIPLLFFTVRKCDDEFKKFLKSFEPSSYVNKGASDSPEELANRAYRVISKLLSSV